MKMLCIYSVVKKNIKKGLKLNLINLIVAKMKLKTKKTPKSVHFDSELTKINFL